jgi:hypothetical protein
MLFVDAPFFEACHQLCGCQGFCGAKAMATPKTKTAMA